MPRRGGGRRGGGSRSRSRSRRSSRRHYRGHHRGYHGRHGYYDGYYGNTHEVGPLGSTIFVFIFGFIAIIIISAFMGNTSTTSITLDPGMTAAEKVNSLTRGSVSVTPTVGDGNIRTYFFDEEPPLSRTINSKFTYNGETLAAYNYASFYSFLNDGSKITVTWTSSSNLKLYIIKGTSNYNSWVNGNDVSADTSFGSSETFTVIVSSSDTYYIVFENTANSLVTYDTAISYDMKVHDISSANSYVSGSIDNYDLSDGKVLVIENLSDSPATVLIAKNPRISFKIYFYGFLALLLGLMYLLYQKFKASDEERKKKRAKLAAANPQPLPQQGYQQQVPQQGYPQATPQQGYQPVTSVLSKPNSNGFYQRPKPMYCPQCGAAVIPNQKFCNACGEKLI